MPELTVPFPIFYYNYCYMVDYYSDVSVIIVAH